MEKNQTYLNLKENIKINLSQAINSLDRLNINQLHNTFCISFNDLKNLEKSGFNKLFIDQIGDDLKNKNVIYTIEVENSDPEKNKEIADVFENKKKYEKVYKLSKFNKVISNYLYVGSSLSIKKRIREHLGFGSKSTYALHLNKWLPNIENTQLVISFLVVKENIPNDNLKFNLLELVEQEIWDMKKPMFGKRSGLL